MRTFYNNCIGFWILCKCILEVVKQLGLVIWVVDYGDLELVCPGILLLSLPVGYLSDQLIVLDFEMLAEYLRDDHGAGGLGVDDAAAVKLLEHPEVEVGVGRDVMTGAGRLPAQLGVAVCVKLDVEGVLGFQNEGVHDIVLDLEVVFCRWKPPPSVCPERITLGSHLFL